MKSPIKLPIVLLITDNLSEVSFFKKLLKEFYYFFHAKTKEEAFEFLESMDITVIIVDEQFPDIAPFELSTSIQSYSSYKNTPILLITSNLKKIYIEQALKAGFTDFLNTPLDEDEVHQRLSVALQPLRTKAKMASFHPQKMPSPSKKTHKFTKGSKEV